MFQDPYASLDPRMRVGTIIREPLKVNRVGGTAAQQEKVGSLLDEVGLSRDGGRAVSPRVLGGAASAHRVGPGPRARPQAHRGRRAGLGPRRLDPGADPQPDEGPAVPARPHVPDDLPRPRRRPVHGGHHRRHVPRQDRRARAGRRGLRAVGPPLHARAAQRRAGGRCRPSPGSGRPGGSGSRASCRRRCSRRRVPIQHPVPGRAAPVHRGGAASCRTSGTATSPPATSPPDARWPCRPPGPPPPTDARPTRPPRARQPTGPGPSYRCWSRTSSESRRASPT